MPRKLESKTAVAELIRQTGLTIGAFAKRVGASASLIREVAAGRRVLSPALHRKIMAVFAGALLPAPSGDVASRITSRCADALAQQVRALVEADDAAVLEIVIALDEILNRRKLLRRVTEVFERDAESHTRETTVEELDREHHLSPAGVPPAWAKISRRHVGLSKIVVVERRVRAWCPVRFPLADGGLVQFAERWNVRVSVTHNGRRIAAWDEERLSLEGVRRAQDAEKPAPVKARASRGKAGTVKPS